MAAFAREGTACRTGLAMVASAYPGAQPYGKRRSVAACRTMQTIVRFAPSPNGRLHLGHAYSAFRNADFAKARQGRFLLRIEDIDRSRSRPAFVTAIEEELTWLGVRWETPVRCQSEHFADYDDAVRRLLALGCLYPCLCGREAIRRATGDRPDGPRDPDGAPLYPGTCRGLPRAGIAARIAVGEKACLRLDMAAALRIVGRPLHWTEFGEDAEAARVEARPEVWGDAVVVRKDVPTSYTLAVVVDDALQGITDVIRGRDLLAATSLQRLLQALLALPEPRYRHHALVYGPDGRKLAKSRGSKTLRSLRDAGLTAEAVIRLARAQARAP